jgi:hypothetical protein
MGAVCIRAQVGFCAWAISDGRLYRDRVAAPARNASENRRFDERRSQQRRGSYPSSPFALGTVISHLGQRAEVVVGSQERLCANCATPRAPSSSSHFSTTYTNNVVRAGRARKQGKPREGMAQRLRVDLGSLTAMRYTVASLRCVPQSTQGVHRVIQSLFLFDVVSGYVKQLPCP